MVIEVRDISKSFRVEKETFTALDRVSCEFRSGMIYGLVGRNGSGKTMLLKSILGLVKIDSGKILFDGKELERPESVGAIIETPGFLPEYTGFKNLKLLAGLTGGISDEEIKRIRTDEYIKLIDTVCGVFAEVLGKDRSEITETSNFVALGGDSMQYVELLSKAGEKTGRQIMMTETPLITPMAIADYIITSTNKAEKDIS